MTMQFLLQQTKMQILSHYKIDEMRFFRPKPIDRKGRAAFCDFCYSLEKKLPQRVIADYLDCAISTVCKAQSCFTLDMRELADLPELPDILSQCLEAHNVKKLSVPESHVAMCESEGYALKAFYYHAKRLGYSAQQIALLVNRNHRTIENVLTGFLKRLRNGCPKCKNSLEKVNISGAKID